MASKSTNRKKTTRRKPQKKQQNFALKNEIIIFAILAVCILLVLSNFGFGGIVGEAVSSVLFGLTGVLAYILPFVIFGVSAFTISNKGNTHAYIKTVATVILSLMLMAFLGLIVDPFDKDMSIFEYYTMSSQHQHAGGLLGGSIIKILCPLIGIAGTYVVIVIMIIICAILITEKSLLTPLQHKGKKAYEDAKKKTETSRINHKKKKEERKDQKESKRSVSRRMDHKVSGVTFDTTLVADSDKKKSPDVKELVPEDMESPLEIQDQPFDDFVINRTEHDEKKTDVPSGVTELFSDYKVEEAIESEIEQPEENIVSKRITKESQEIVEVEKEKVEKTIEEHDTKQPVAYSAPPISLLKKGKKSAGDSDSHLRGTALKLEQTLQNFGVGVHVTNASCGPSVTRYELQPDQGVKVSRIVGLADDIKLNLAVTDLRIEAPIPGKAAVGIEVPNKENTAVMLRDLIDSSEFKNNKASIPFAVGKDIAGKTVVADIAKMPHLLVAGATGSGKSVCINTLIMSIIYTSNPEDVKLIMVDPKVVELSVYNGIPHLLIPVVTDPKKAAGALNWAVAEMEKRYKLFAEYNVRDLAGFNEKVEHMEPGEGVPKKMPKIVIIVDELADLMMVAPGEVEGAICRLAQLARAAGLHLILATQRPSVNVITGLIKANMPSRIAFAVSSGVDSRTIIDMNGAEKLLGKGDMLFYPTGYPKPVRVQGSFVSDKEVQSVVNHLITHNGNVSYNTEIEEHVSLNSGNGAMVASGTTDDRDIYFVEAGKLIIDKDKASIGMLQRMFKIGFNRAARIMDQLAQAEVVGPEEGTKPRKILMTLEEFEKYVEENI